MEFRILGPLEVSERGRALPLGGVKRRVLLAILLINANRVVSPVRLLDLLWGAQPPETAADAVQVYVAHLRRLLEPMRPAGGPYRGPSEPTSGLPAPARAGSARLGAL